MRTNLSKMTNSKGYRRGTRYMFRRPFRKNGMPSVSTLLKVYKIGDIVDIKADGSVHAGMPHKYYHGRTGRVFNVTNRSLGVVVSKPVRNRIEKKKICIRAEHVRHSSCRQDFLDRVKRNDTTRRECKKNGTAVPDLKRSPSAQGPPTLSGPRTTSPRSSSPSLTGSSSKHSRLDGWKIGVPLSSSWNKSFILISNT